MTPKSKAVVNEAWYNIVSALNTYAPGSDAFHDLVYSELMAMAKKIEDHLNTTHLNERLEDAKQSSKSMFDFMSAVMGGKIQIKKENE